MPSSISIFCSRCGLKHRVKQYKEDRFCRDCGSLLVFGDEGGGSGWRSLFPYEPYPQHVEFIHDVEKVVGRGQVLIAEACNGFGKTISSLSCLLPLSKQIIYATRTHEQVRQVLIELENINKKSGKSYTAVNLASRDFLCLNQDCRDLPNNEAQELCHNLRKSDECSYASELQSPPRGFPPILSKETLLEEGRRRELCPYFLARLMSRLCRVIVTPYPYVFNPMIRLTTGLDLEGKILILDEGHNIDQVSQDTMSDTLTEPGLGSTIEELRLIGESTGLINRLGEHLLRSVGDKPRLVSAETLVEELESALGIDLNVFTDRYALFVETIRLKKTQAGKPPVSYLNGLLAFFELLQNSVKEKYVAVYTRNYYGSPIIEYRCLDPSLALKPLVEEADGVLIMSGTLSPLDTFSKIIGLEGAVKKSYPSIQKSSRISMVIEMGVTSSYSERSVNMMALYGEVISNALRGVSQGALLFFTQRGFMNTCLDVWRRKGFIKARDGRMFLGGKELYREGIDARRNREVVSRYKRKAVSLGGAVLCCVFRGRNSEGSNFPDDEARAIILVGVPYANYSDPLIRAQIKYFNRVKAGLGNEWYTMEAFRAANQSLGRGIRGRDDWCRYWLLDRRYYENIDLLSKWATGIGPTIVNTLNSTRSLNY